jgi:hypothetical protein
MVAARSCGCLPVEWPDTKGGTTTGVRGQGSRKVAGGGSSRSTVVAARACGSLPVGRPDTKGSAATGARGQYSREVAGRGSSPSTEVAARSCGCLRVEWSDTKDTDSTFRRKPRISVLVHLANEDGYDVPVAQILLPSLDFANQPVP